MWRQRHDQHGRFNLAGSPCRELGRSPALLERAIELVLFDIISANKDKVEFSALEEGGMKEWKQELRNAIVE